MTSKEMLNELNSFVENVASVEECRKLLSDYSKTIDGFVIFGAQQAGIRLKRTLEKYGYDVLCFMDDVLSMDNLDGKKVIHNINEAKEKYPHPCWLISSTIRTSVRVMQEKLINVYGNPDILRQEVLTYINGESSLKTSDSVFLEYMSMAITNVCTLNCRGCCTNTPYIPKELKEHLTFEGIRDDVDALSKMVDAVNVIYITGGEPLLHPNLDKILYRIREKINPGQLSIPTNGTVVPDDKMLRAIKDTDTIIRVDDYGKLSSKINALISDLKKYDILYFVQESAQFPWAEYENLYDRKTDGKKQFEICRDWLRYTLYKRRLYPCYCMSRIDERHFYEIPDKEWIDIYGCIDDEKKKFKSFDKIASPPSSCRYCGVTDRMIKAAVQLPRNGI